MPTYLFFRRVGRLVLIGVVMNKMRLVLPLILGFAASSAWGAGNAAPEPHMSGLEAALTDCAAKVKKDSEGMPDQKAMEACMKAKGFGGPEATPSSNSKPKAK
jgi:hypothetical protein